MNANKYRTHTCGQLRKSDVGTNVTLSGWLHRKRDHGGLLFIDLRDHYGITQLVFNNESHDVDNIANIRPESVLTVKGTVKERSDDTINKAIPTGEIEITIDNLNIETAANELPLNVFGNESYPEDIRLKYRFIDLRREELHKNIVTRCQIIAEIRSLMSSKGFLEFQTPILTASSPEGARDFLVPSRLHPGKFYALPQAPQQFKQLLMIAGFDKYFQIAPCFRDEDARADRSPGEFYQLDIEMSFVTQEDIFRVTESVIYELFKKFSNGKIVENAFPHITYDDAMLKYGCDKPDLRNPIQISDAADVFRESGFSIFANNIERGMIIRAIPAPNTCDKPRSFFDNKITFAQSLGAKGLAYIIFDKDGTAKGPIAKLLDQARLDTLKQICELENGDSVFFSCGNEEDACKIAHEVRLLLGKELDLIDNNKFAFCWVTDFPYFEYNHETTKIDFSHNPFSMPQSDISQIYDPNELLKVKAYQYDLVCNGVELSSGAIRNHKLDVMYRAFEIVGYTREEIDTEFRGLVTALKYGPPPHGGIAPGVDRMVMLLTDAPNLREVTCFPMNQNAQDLMMSAPSNISARDLKVLGLQILKKEKAK